MNIEGLIRVPLLQTLPRSRVEDLAGVMLRRRFVARQVVAREGDPATHLVVVESGSLSAAHVTAAGRRVQFGAVTGPCIVDKAATLYEAVHTATWTSTTACHVRLLPGLIFRDLLDQEPEFREHVLHHLAGQVSSHRRSRMRFAAPGPVARVADWAVEAHQAFGRVIKLAGGQQGLGEELGLSRVTVNRSLSALVTLGAIEVRSGLIEVLDLARLTTATTTGHGTNTRGARRRLG